MFFKDPRNDRAVLLCDCGCGKGLEFLYIDGSMYIEVLNGGPDTLHTLFKRYFRFLAGNRIISDMTIFGHDIQDLLTFLKQYPVTDKAETSEPIYTRITANYAGYGLYEILLYSSQPRLSWIRNWYRSFEIVLTSKERRKLIRRIEKLLEKHPPKDNAVMNGWH